MESSMMYAELAICFGRYRSIQRGARLVLVNRRLEMRQLDGVTSRKIMSSVNTWLLGERGKCYGILNLCVGMQLLYVFIINTAVDYVFSS